MGKQQHPKKERFDHASSEFNDRLPVEQRLEIGLGEASAPEIDPFQKMINELNENPYADPDAAVSADDASTKVRLTQNLMEMRSIEKNLKELDEELHRLEQLAEWTDEQATALPKKLDKISRRR